MTTTINFIYHPSVREGRHPGRVRMRVTHERKSRSVTLPFDIYPEEWNEAARAIVIDAGVPPHRREYLGKALVRMRLNESMVSSIALSLAERGRYHVDDVMSAFLARDDNGKLMNYAAQLAGELARQGRERTGKAYLTAARGLIEFNKGRDIYLKHINARLISDFEADLKARGKSPNTIFYYMRMLRVMYNKAVKAKRITAQEDNPFADVYTGVSKTRKRALPMEELNRLYNLDFTELLERCGGDRTERRKVENLYFSWRLFFFCLHSRGMCFVDLAYLRKENIKGGVLKYYRRKTGGLMEVKVTAQMARIIDSFRDDVAGSDYLFPIITDPECSQRAHYENGLNLQNKRLKQLAKIAGIKSNISTHVARHTWASMCKYNNVPLWVISEGLGHQDEKTTYTYLASLDRSVLDYANEVITEQLLAAARKKENKPGALHQNTSSPLAVMPDYPRMSGL